ncbi:hypothetical protein IE53DRAFT_383680 [Violaceomyces palustris]|uniref:Uncharacterized protein n=1 Tax=Violaceomyces palustris TaxID=1673888 RepID=A0ACD0P6S5_9BASI|nr:hypothetical protein IE53DRAFT_383680 [Violaceomyces palustris]
MLGVAMLVLGGAVKCLPRELVVTDLEAGVISSLGLSGIRSRDMEPFLVEPVGSESRIDERLAKRRNWSSFSTHLEATREMRMQDHRGGEEPLVMDEATKRGIETRVNEARPPHLEKPEDASLVHYEYGLSAHSRSFGRGYETRLVYVHALDLLEEFGEDSYLVFENTYKKGDWRRPGLNPWQLVEEDAAEVAANPRRVRTEWIRLHSVGRLAFNWKEREPGSLHFAKFLIPTHISEGVAPVSDSRSS